MNELEVGATIDALVPNGTGEFPFGGLAEVLIASRLQDKPLPIYEISDWAHKTVVPLLFGIPADKLNDDRLGAMLDAVRPHRNAIWARVLGRAVTRFGLDLSTLHADPTKIAFEGSYEGWDDLPPDVPCITYGKPKDGQVDRKLVTLSQWVSADGGVPVWMGLADGNAADDPLYVRDLRELREALPLNDILVIAGDCKLPSHEMVLQCFRWNYQLVATEPWRKTRRERLAKLLRRGATWERLEYIAESDRKKPDSERGHYDVIADVEKLKDAQTGAVYTLRRLFVRSSRKADQARAKRDQQLAKLKAELERLQGLVNKYHYTTVEAVKDRAGQIIGKNPAGRFIQIQVTRTRAKIAPIRLTWSVPRKPMQAAAQWDGVYSILTNLPAATHSANEVLTIYKGQHHVEGRFRNMNQLPIRVRPLWLKRPDRIETLIFLVMLAVLIYALVERQVHRHIAETGQKIEGLMPEKRDTFTPSGLRLLGAFAAVCLVRWDDGQSVRFQLSELSAVHRQILKALGLADLSTLLIDRPKQMQAAELLAQA
jgi:transposase